MSMAMAAAGSPARPLWATEAARIAVLVAVICEIVVATVPARLYLPGFYAGDAATGWPYAAISAVIGVQTFAAILAMTLLPLVALHLWRASPAWVRRAALAFSAVLGLGVVLLLALASPGLGNALFDLAGAGSPAPVAATLIFLPLMLQLWAVPLVLTAVLGALAGRVAAGLAGLAALIVAGITLAMALQDGGPVGKALVLIAAGLWLWLTLARGGTIPASAQPWLAALFAIWILPEALGVLPALIDALQIISPQARWDAAVQTLGRLPAGAGMDDLVCLLLALLALLHLRRPVPPARWAWPVATLLVLGVAGSVVAWEMGVSGPPALILDGLRSGATGPVAALGGAVVQLMWYVAIPLRVLIAVAALRHPLRDGDGYGDGYGDGGGA